MVQRDISFGFGISILACAGVVILGLLIRQIPIPKEQVPDNSLEFSGQYSPQKAREAPVLSESDPSLGPEDAPVTIIEFADFRCPYCIQAYETVAYILEAYRGKVRYVWKDVPSPTHSGALESALAARCAQAQGAFWEYHSYLFTNPLRYGEDFLRAGAEQVHLDQREFISCLENATPLPFVRQTLAEAEGLGLREIPYFFINGRRLAGAPTIAELQSVIEQELATLPQ